MAIDFPTSPSTNDTHTTSGGITYLWDGTSWKAQGTTSQYSLPTASATVLGGIKVGSGLTINAGVLAATAGSQTLDQVLATGNTTSRDIDTTGKILFSNNYAASGDLPSATTYHGMFAHVHAEGHGYFAHAGAWTQLLDTGSSINELADVTTGTISTGDVLTWSGSEWEAAAPTGGGGGGANVTISDTIPAGSPSAGDLWWESDTGRLKVYYTDTDSSQWVDTSPPLADATTIGASGTVSMKAHILPDTNAAHDIGSAEYKIRHLFLSDNTLYHEGPFIKTAQHDAGGSAQTTSYVITLAKLKEAVTASADYDAFKAAILAITDAT